MKTNRHPRIWLWDVTFAATAGAFVWSTFCLPGSTTSILALQLCADIWKAVFDGRASGWLLLIVTAIQALFLQKQVKINKLQADTSQMIERAYVFLAPPIGVVESNEAQRSVWPGEWISFSLKNYGRTPAMIRRIRLQTNYIQDGWPSMDGAYGIDLPPTIIAGPNDTLGPLYRPFTVPEAMVTKAESGHGKVLFWGEIEYEDVYGVKRVTGFCRRLDASQGRFIVAECSSLNYFS